MVASLIQKGKKAIYSEQQSILSAASVIAFMYAIAALLGFIKNRLLAHYFGDSTELGVFFAADVIPSFIYTMIVAGAMSAAFIPVFKRKKKQNKQLAWEMTSSVLNSLLLVFSFFAILIFIFAKPIASQIIAGQSTLPDADLTLMSQLIRVMMGAQIVLIFSSVLTGLLESFNRFIISAFAPVVYNLGIIISIVFLYQYIGIYAPAVGMVVGSLFHVSIQIPFVKRLGYKYKPIINFKDKAFKEIIRLTIPRVIGNAAPQTLKFVFTNLVLFISAPSMVVWKFASDLQLLPIRLFGTSISRAALPFLTDAVKENDIKDFKILLVKTITQTMFFIFPISILIFVLKVPLVRLAVGSKLFSWGATIMTAYTLAFFSISVAVQAITNVLIKAFYALKDTRTPVLMSFLTVAISSVLGVYFVKYLGWGVWSLAFAYSIGSFFEFITLYLLLQKKIGQIPVLGNQLNRIIIATLLMGVAVYIPIKLLDEVVIDTTRTIGLLTLTGFVSALGIITYFYLSKLLMIDEFKLIVDTGKRILKSFRR